MDNEKQLLSSGRRNAIKTLSALGATVYAPFVLTRSRAAPKQQIVIRDPGGVLSRLYKEVFYEPFSRKTGIKVIGVFSDAEPTAYIRTMIETESRSWDMASLSHRAILFLTTGRDVYLEKHGLENDPVISAIPSRFISPYGVGTNVYTTVLAYRTDVFKKNPPQTWKDFWNVKDFPGRRSLRKLPFDTIEEALMADDVSPDGVYPCNLDQAFRKLDKIKPHISFWWTSGPQIEQVLNTGEIDLMPALISKLQAATSAGAPFKFSWDQHIYGYDNWAIFKGSPNANACREFIKFASNPERQALLARYAIGPTQPNAFNYIDPKQAKLLQTYPDNLRKGLFIDASYWLKNQSIAIERFNQWMLN
ncbi:FAD/FMN-containing dehydrogenase [Mycoavidus cysteinexigens]|uniref:FAD/FMN-containing dehydrogenase n=1 Tax=Mycoavidus cysteinexigens TaxID=1553431 RepID=A0A2Z6EV31_9BURK|nr:ABC transporter substrate-binding protein [Mycoavidus cysteinexigens]BBE09304.1 FAD/FMN-containing dehydrogenase [Mycoavidus cysteinexigens]GAM51940.1 ABC transporter, periplasmic spermidine putrescine-binding protein PotD [bacterium endosymbiont of Mortierella elongata FMR23-6]GLR02037.1 dehydrogenase [Mycoavidus cysteinexigens]